LKPILVFNSRIAKLLKVSGIVLYPFVLFATDKQTAWVDRTYHHEMLHVEQVKRVGFFNFYISYVLFYLAFRMYGLKHFDAYLSIPWEEEAFAKQGEE
jgi:hypothetical protein